MPHRVRNEKEGRHVVTGPGRSTHEEESPPGLALPRCARLVDRAWVRILKRQYWRTEIVVVDATSKLVISGILVPNLGRQQGQ